MQSFWLDEAVTVSLMRLDLADMLAAIPDSESTPPLYYVLAWLWTRLFGTGEVGLRSLSALAGVLTVPAAYAAGHALLSRRAGLPAAALVAVNPFLVWYGQEARAYALLVLLGTVALWAAARGRPALWAAASLLALATHYFALFAVAPLALWMLRRRAMSPLRARVAAVAAVAAGGVALLPLALRQASGARAAFIEDTGLLTRLVQVPKQFLVGFDSPLESLLTALAVVLAVGIAVAGLRGGSRDDRRGIGGALALAGFALLVPLALALAGADYVLARNLVVALVPCLLVLGAGVAASRVAAAAGAALALLSIAIVVAVAVSPELQRDDWRGAAAAIGDAPRGRAIVVVPASGTIPLQVYRPRIRPAPTDLRLGSEVALIGLGGQRPGGGLAPPRTTGNPLPNPPFGPARRAIEPTWTVLRVPITAPTPFPDDGLTYYRLGYDPAAVVIEPGPAVGPAR